MLFDSVVVIGEVIVSKTKKDREKKRAKGSDSATKVIDLAHRGLELFSEHEPRAMGHMQKFMREAAKGGAIDKKTKELMVLGMAIAIRCHYCIAVHIRACKAADVSVEEIMEVCTLAVMMGGGPALMYVAEVERALNKYYLDDEGEPI